MVIAYLRFARTSCHAYNGCLHVLWAVIFLGGGGGVGSHTFTSFTLHELELSAITNEPSHSSNSISVECLTEMRLSCENVSCRMS